MRTLSERARDIRCAVFDVDGVMTDCKLYLAPDGSELKAVHVRDGLGLKLLMQAGIEVAVISGRPSAAMQARFEYLGIKRVWLNVEHKLPAWEELKAQLGIGARPRGRFLQRANRLDQCVSCRDRDTRFRIGIGFG